MPQGVASHADCKERLTGMGIVCPKYRLVCYVGMARLETGPPVELTNSA
jgi:hypothetical protein